MLSLPASLRIFLCRRPTDMRKSFDGLMGLVQEVFEQDAVSGHLFVFINRRRDRMKMLYWDRDGLCIWYKRLEAGTFQSFPHVARGDGGDGIELSPTDLALLLEGIDLASARRRKRFRRAG
jgi:hypothetical protein